MNQSKIKELEEVLIAKNDKIWNEYTKMRVSFAELCNELNNIRMGHEILNRAKESSNNQGDV